MKKIVICLLILCNFMFVVHSNSVSAFEYENSAEFGNVRVELAKDKTYILEEGGQTTYVQFNTELNIVSVNGVNYSLNDYLEAAEIQFYDELKNPISYYLSEFTTISDVSSDIPHSFMEPYFVPLPTTGYGKETFAFDLPEITLKFLLSNAVYVSVMAYMNFKSAGQAQTLVIAVRNAAISFGLITANQAYNASILNAHYHSVHTTISGAVKRRIRPYTKVLNQRFNGEYSAPTYFWSSKPW